MEITFQYFDGCPNWQTTRDRLNEVLADRDDVELTMQRVETPEEAAKVAFRGSPTILLDGVDPFAGDEATAAGTLACRVYQSEDGSPSVEQLREALSHNG